jgi:hypothetical protein
VGSWCWSWAAHSRAGHRTGPREVGSCKYVRGTRICPWLPSSAERGACIQRGLAGSRRFNTPQCANATSWEWGEDADGCHEPRPIKRSLPQNAVWGLSLRVVGTAASRWKEQGACHPPRLVPTVGGAVRCGAKAGWVADAAAACTISVFACGPAAARSKMVGPGCACWPRPVVLPALISSPTSQSLTVGRWLVADLSLASRKPSSPYEYALLVDGMN